MAKKTDLALNPIIVITGDKGGVGKSLVAITLLEYLIGNKTPVAIIDTDMTNPDVHALYENSLKSAHINLEEKDGGGWMKLVEFAESTPETIIVNMKAGSKTSIEENQKFIGDALRMLQRPVVMFFVLGLQKQCSILFYDALNLFPTLHAAIAVKNLKNGDIDEFFNWDEAKQNEAFKSVKEIIFPKVHARISLKITDDDMMISELLDGGKLRISERAALQSWLDSVFASYDGIKESIGI